MAYFPDGLRAALRSELGTVIPAENLDEVADLAIHAAESAILTLTDVCKRGSEPRIALAAFGPAVSLVMTACKSEQERLKEFAGEQGLSYSEATVKVG